VQKSMVRKTDDLSMSLPVAGLTCLALRAAPAWMAGRHSVNFRNDRDELARFADDLDGVLELGRRLGRTR
jgi:hypothetical protein